MSNEAWVLAIVAIAVAVLGPPIADQVKRWWRGPKLVIVYEHKPPMSRKASRTYHHAPQRRDPIYDIHFQIGNEGETRAEKIEAVLEEIWDYDSAGKPHKVQGFWAVRLRFDGNGAESIDLNPHRQVQWNLGNIPCEEVQAEMMKFDRFVDIPGKQGTDLRFFLDVDEFPFFQPNVLLPGKYGIKVVLYSSNAPRKHRYFIIDWNGEWRDTEEEMFKQIVITPVSSIK